MSNLEIILLAIALGIDCFIASFSQGIALKNHLIRNSLVLAATMGLFQGLMPAAGYYGAATVHKYVENFSHWLVFTIFLLLGIKFIIDAFKQKEDGLCAIAPRFLITIGVATSIDALAAGVSIKFSHGAILIPAVIIGFISFVMSLAGFWTGNCLCKFPSKTLEIFGGLILIALAFKAVIF